MSRTLKLILMLVLLVVGGAGVIALRLRGKEVPPQQVTHVDDQQKAAASGPATSSGPAIDPAAIEAAEAAYSEGMKSYDSGEILKARELLSKAYFLEALSIDKQAKARVLLEQLAQRTIFSREIIPGDPYTFSHIVVRGDNLQALERRYALHVPTQLIMDINKIQRAEDLRQGQQIKMLFGPFHATVTKSEFVMDLYLEREGLPRIFVKRMSVGLGRNGSTPVGAWHVTLSQPALPPSEGVPGQVAKSGKLVKARWDPPPNSGVLNPIEYGAPDYPLGVKGLWISLEGDDENTRLMRNYGIHSTNDPASIGKEGSLGCIRLNDVDIELVFSLLYEKWSTVRTRP